METLQEVEKREYPRSLPGDAVSAIIEGRKTQMREVVALDQQILCLTERCKGEEIVQVYRDGVNISLDWHDIRLTSSQKTHAVVTYPYGNYGDRIWVQETFADKPGSDGAIWYAADFKTPEAAGNSLGLKWNNATSLPRSHCRLLLEITAVRVEYLQQLTRRDAQVEGIVCPCCKGYHSRACSCIEMFAKAWDQGTAANRGATWNSNPPVWVTTFAKVTEELA